MRALIRNTPIGIQHPALEIFQGDILDVIALEEAMRGITKVYHVAGFVSFHQSDELAMHRMNVKGTANMVNASLAAGVGKFLHVSSVAALGRIRKGDKVNELSQWTEDNNNSNYGRTKYLGEMEVWRGIAEGLNAVIVNPSIILGPGNWEESSSRLFKHVYEESPWYTEGVTGVVDVRDVADAMIGLMESNISAQKFIINASNVSYRDLFTLIAVNFGKKPPTKRVTPLLAKIVTLFESIKYRVTGIKPLITAETANTGMAKVYFDNSKILKALPGFAFRSLEETVAYTTQVFKQKFNNT